jgi:NAD(P)H dehydrogenase (quinone)
MGMSYDTSEVARYAKTLKEVDGLILCFPHWWFSMPAILKGWVDRVWGPGVAFTYDPKDNHLTPALINIRLFGVVTTYGSPWMAVHWFAGNAGHKVLMRGMKPMCAKDARSFYLAHYDMDHSTDQSRQAFFRESPDYRRRNRRLMIEVLHKVFTYSGPGRVIGTDGHAAPA